MATTVGDDHHRKLLIMRRRFGGVDGRASAYADYHIQPVFRTILRIFSISPTLEVPPKIS